MHYIETKKGLETLLKRYQEVGVTDDKYPVDRWITCITQCIESLNGPEPLSMGEVDWENTPVEPKPLWRGLK